MTSYVVYDEAERLKAEAEHAKWHTKPKEERKELSRNWLTLPTGTGDWKKWCENCGREFRALETSRRMCSACHWKKVYGGGYDLCVARMLHVSKMSHHRKYMEGRE